MIKLRRLLAFSFFLPGCLWAQNDSAETDEFDASGAIIVQNNPEQTGAAPDSGSGLAGETASGSGESSGRREAAAAPADGESRAGSAEAADETEESESARDPGAGADQGPDENQEVVEIPEREIEGARLDDAEGEPDIPRATEAVPDGSDVVLELPGEEGGDGEGGATVAEEDTISVDFPDEDVRTILRNVADLFELNLVIPDSLQGRTSLKLRNVTWRQVFEVVLEPLGFTFVEDRNIIRIKSIEDLTSEPVDTRVFVVNYASASELRPSIEPLVDGSAGGRIQVDQRSNALVITERPSRMNKIQEIIDRLDNATDQIMIESKFIEVTNTDIKDLGVNWTSLQGQRVSAGPFQRQFSRERSKNEGSEVEDGFESSSSTETNSGTGTSPTSSTEESVTSTFNRLDDVASTASTSRIDSAVFSAEEFEVILSALETANDVKLVANPTVVTLDNKKASIDIAEFFPNPDFTFNAETGQRQLNGVDIEEDGIRVGILLEVTPQVNAAGFINMEVEPTVSRSDREVTIEGSDFPVIDKRTTKTNVMIKDGFTLAIGGLVENSTTQRDTKVPFLGDIPGLGRLFSSESDQIEQRNLIIFLTAKTLNPDGSTYRDVVDPRVLESMDILPQDLPGYDIPDPEQERLDRLEEMRKDRRTSERLNKLDGQIEAINRAKREAEEKKAEEEESGQMREPRGRFGS